jgi:hypothetical protein
LISGLLERLHTSGLPQTSDLHSLLLGIVLNAYLKHVLELQQDNGNSRYHRRKYASFTDRGTVRPRNNITATDTARLLLSVILEHLAHMYYGLVFPMCDAGARKQEFT